MSYYTAKVVVSTQEKALIEEQTREQSNCSFWAEERTKELLLLVLVVLPK